VPRSADVDSDRDGVIGTGVVRECRACGPLRGPRTDSVRLERSVDVSAQRRRRAGACAEWPCRAHGLLWRPNDGARGGGNDQSIAASVENARWGTRTGRRSCARCCTVGLRRTGQWTCCGRRCRRWSRAPDRERAFVGNGGRGLPMSPADAPHSSHAASACGRRKCGGIRRDRVQALRSREVVTASSVTGASSLSSASTAVARPP
jgi:hypothetical protein